MAGLFKDNTGKTSSLRIAWFLSVIAIVFTWMYVSLDTGVLQHLTAGDAAWFGVLFGGKVAQSFIENNKKAT